VQFPQGLDLKGGQEIRIAAVIASKGWLAGKADVLDILTDAQKEKLKEKLGDPFQLRGAKEKGAKQPGVRKEGDKKADDAKEAARDLKIALSFLDEVREQNQKRKFQLSEQNLRVALRRLQEVIDRYRDTDAAAQAREVLDRLRKNGLE
jgi:hypothetical protein